MHNIERVAKMGKRSGTACCQVIHITISSGLLHVCQVGPNLHHMTSAYEIGRTPTIEVHHRLRIAREFAELEQAQLAELIGVSRTTIGNAESGRVKPRRITVNAWALACGVPASWILTGNSGNDPAGGPDSRTKDYKAEVIRPSFGTPESSSGTAA